MADRSRMFEINNNGLSVFVCLLSDVVVLCVCVYSAY